MEPTHDEASGDDVVTRLQQDLALVCERLFVSIGSLQRDAPPQALQDEDIWNVHGGQKRTEVVQQEDIQETAKTMGNEIRESLETLKRSIDALPENSIMNHDEQKMLESLMEKNVCLDRDLQDALKRAEDHAGRVERVHGALIDALLCAQGSRYLGKD